MGNQFPTQLRIEHVLLGTTLYAGAVYIQHKLQRKFVCDLIDGDIPAGIAGWPDFGLGILQTDSPAFLHITKQVAESLPAFEVVRAKRVWNRVLWEAFLGTRSRVGGEVGTVQPLTKLLFHGSDHKTLQAIVGSSADADLKDSERLGFDLRLSGRGEYSEPKVASYFAQYAIYPVRIHPCKQDENRMFTILMAEVICGRSYNCDVRHKCVKFSRPPPNAQGETCHSVEGTEPGLKDNIPDKIENISDEWSVSLHSNKLKQEFARQFVVYNRLMAYPHFIITLREMELHFCENKDSRKSVFELESFPEANADWFSIKTFDGKYVSVTNGGYVRLASHRCDLGKFERVQVRDSETPRFCQLHTVNNRWLSAQEDGRIGLEVNRGDPGNRETFKLIPEDESGDGRRVVMVSPSIRDHDTYLTVK